MVRFAVLAALLSGCAQMFGLDETTGEGRPRASLFVERVSVGAQAVTSPLALGDLTAAYLVPEPTDPTGLVRVPAAPSAPGTWTADRPQAAPVLFQLPDFRGPIPRLYDFPNLALRVQYAVLEHPDPLPAPAEATLVVDVALDTPYVAGEGLLLMSVGTWAQRALEAPAPGAVRLTTPAFPYATMTPLTARPLERITAADQLVVLRYSGNQLIGAARPGRFEQTGADTLTGDMITVQAAPLDVRIDPAAAAARYAAVRPQVTPQPMTWAVRAAPGGVLGIDTGPQLQAGAVQPTDPPLTIAAPFGNPFEVFGWGSTFVWSSVAQRAYTPPSSGLPATLYAAMSERVVPGPGTTLTLPAGLPEAITIDGVPLSTDGLSISRPTRPVQVSFLTGVPSNTLYQIQVFRLVPNEMNNALAFQLQLATAGVEPLFAVPPEVFEPGGLYTIRAIAVQGGYPGIRDGDLTQRTLPLATALLDSGVFQVMP